MPKWLIVIGTIWQVGGLVALTVMGAMHWTPPAAVAVIVAVAWLVGCWLFVGALAWLTPSTRGSYEPYEGGAAGFGYYSDGGGGGG